MGRVYLGVAPAGYAAVKRVLPYLADDATFLRHFGQELDNQARLPAGVSARLLAADRTARPPWFATEYVAGVTLHEAVYLNGGSLPAETAWLLLRELAQRLKSVAALDMVHRDLKPSNVMLTGSGVTLIDFGVSRAADQSTVTATGMIVGTPAYMAPEQARAVKSLSPAVDVFSLGGVVTFAATGEPPFGAGSGTDLLFRIVHEQPDLDALRARDAELADVVASCLAKDPAQRPAAADILALVDQRTVAETGQPAWPVKIMEQIAIRSEFAATATEVGEIAEDEPDVQPDAAVPAQQMDPAMDPSAEAETVPVPVQLEPVKQYPKKEKDRKRRRLVLIVPLILATGTAGTVIALHEVPFVSSARGGGSPPVSVSSVRSTAKAGTSASSRPTASRSAQPAASGSASSSAGSSAASSSNANAVSQRNLSSGNSASSTSSNSNAGGNAATTAARTTAAAASGPSGPGGDSALVSGSEVSVNDCAGWLDYSSSYFFKGTVSAGSSANCEEEFYWAVTYYNSTPNPQPTADISASNGGTASATSCGSGNGCGYGAYEMGAKICVWNKSDSGNEKCSAVYVYHNSTGTITQG